VARVTVGAELGVEGWEKAGAEQSARVNTSAVRTLRSLIVAVSWIYLMNGGMVPQKGRAGAEEMLPKEQNKCTRLPAAFFRSA
jgi:hypothetical protein